LRALPAERAAGLLLHQHAIQTCTQLVAEYPDHSTYRQELRRSHYALGIALEIMGRWAEAGQAHADAVAACERWPDQNDDNPPAIYNRAAWLLATCPDVTTRNPRRAVELARKATALDPRPDHWNTLGAAEYRADDFKAALAALDESMARNNGGN